MRFWHRLHRLRRPLHVAAFAAAQPAAVAAASVAEPAAAKPVAAAAVAEPAAARRLVFDVLVDFDRLAVLPY